MKKILAIAAITASLLLTSAPCQAAVDLATWAANPQTAGGVTYTLDPLNTTLPANWEFSFSSIGGFTAQSSNMGDPAVPITGMGPWSLAYTAVITGGELFSSVSVDSTIVGDGNTYVGKEVRGVTGGLLANANSLGGANSGFVNFSTPSSSIYVKEIIWAGANNAVTGFDNTYTVVPEPSTVVAGCLLVLPFAASTIRFMRKNRKA